MDKCGEIILIGDTRVKKIPVQDNGEAIVDLAVEFPDLAFDFDRRHVQKKSVSISFARRELGKKLLQAQAKLPSGIKLVVKECYRPMFVQKGFWERYSSDLAKDFPNWSEEKVYTECSKLVAPIEVAPHTTGGAVDLTLADASGKWLDMGTEFNASPLETQNATYTNAENISELARKNRKLLIEIMTTVGFVNYPTEWWHWSYGDKYWALLTGEPHAIYDSKEVDLVSHRVEVRDLNFQDDAELLKVSELFVAVPLSWDPAYTYSKESVEKNRDWMHQKRETLKCLLATTGDSIVGLHLLRIDTPGAEHCFIQSLWIEEKFRGRGLGSRLKAMGEAWAKSKDAKKIVTHVFLDNPKMIAINEAKGFKKVKVELHKNI